MELDSVLKLGLCDPNVGRAIVHLLWQLPVGLIAQKLKDSNQILYSNLEGAGGQGDRLHADMKMPKHPK